MSQYNLARVARLLKAHSVPIQTEAGRLLARDVVFTLTGQDISAWVDVTEWSARALYQWLGY